MAFFPPFIKKGREAGETSLFFSSFPFHFHFIYLFIRLFIILGFRVLVVVVSLPACLGCVLRQSRLAGILAWRATEEELTARFSLHRDGW